LTLPGAEREVLTEGEPPLDAAADLELAADDDDEPAAENAVPRTQGLVASGSLDDSN
jgi:hypothetical protein